MTHIIFDSPTFWHPSNANGIAANIRGTINEKQFTINLYWAGTFLAIHKELSLDKLMNQAISFQKNYIPHDDDAINLHFQFNGDEFVPIADPKWTPGTKRF